ncbi:DUF6328 family protein [Actinoplanes sp. NPDC023801]|uniref:DUF6328 family protein n=1 Tax=Actinoplanes sp. NPDC023801 TaxID=3154595 RepID=UPI0034049211
MVHETEKQRWERNFEDLLRELRVAQTGVQILFTFLLALPFTSRFDAMTGPQRIVHLVALLATACGTAAVIAPVAMHRALFRRGRKPALVRFTHRASIIALGCMLTAMVASVLLVAGFVLSPPAASILTVVTTGWPLFLWALLPLSRRGTAPDRELSAHEVAVRINQSCKEPIPLSRRRHSGLRPRNRKVSRGLRRV